MKIAFVNQPIDCILPPFQSSIGACTYGAVRPLSRQADVLVYGIQDRHEDAEPLPADNRVRYRFFPATLSDRLIYKARTEFSRRVTTREPISTSRWFFPDFARQVALDLKREECDIVHVQHCSQYVPVIRALNPHSKLVLHLHAEWFSQTNRAVLERRLKKVDFVTTVSNYITEKTRRDFPQIADRCETSYNGIDAEQFCCEREYEAATRRSEKRLFYAGALSPHKGLHVLLDAFKLVAGKHPNVRLDIVGLMGNYPLSETFDREDRAALESVSQFYNRETGLRSKSDAPSYLSQLKSRLTPSLLSKVNFWGLVPRRDLLRFYYDADVFVFPSVWNEGFGIPPVEAMAAGVPVVGTRSGALVETVCEGETGFLVEKNDPVALARSILKLLEDDALREAMGRAARERALRLFTWDNVAQSMYSRYLALSSLAARQIFSGERYVLR
jgi:glycosyltransferase involved in cell wall biosynthesis